MCRMPKCNTHRRWHLPRQQGLFHCRTHYHMKMYLLYTSNHNHSNNKMTNKKKNLLFVT